MNDLPNDLPLDPEALGGIVELLKHTPQVRQALGEIVQENIAEYMLAIEKRLAERSEKQIAEAVPKIRDGVASQLKDELKPVIDALQRGHVPDAPAARAAYADGQPTNGQTMTHERIEDTGDGQAGGLSEIGQLIGLFRMLQGNKGGQAGGLNQVLGQVEQYTQFMGKVTESLTGPLFNYYSLGFNHALNFFGQFSRADDETREQFAGMVGQGIGNPLSIAQGNSSVTRLRDTKSEAERLAGRV